MMADSKRQKSETVEARLAAHIAGLQFEQLSPEALTAVDRLYIDTIASMLSGFGNAECREIVRKLLLSSQAGRFTVVGNGRRTDPSTAALANGIFAHWCEWDDVHDAAGIHGSAVIYPALMAAAEWPNSLNKEEAGREFVTAVVAAYDVAARVGLALNTTSFHGWMTTGAAASIASAGAAARLMGLNEAGILSAMGIAATGGGLSRQPLADRVNGKNALCGMAAKNAIDAARMAATGLVGASNFFEGSFGINALHAGGKAEVGSSLDDLGQKFSIVDAGVKIHPSCRSTHPSIDLVLDLLAEFPEIANDVEDIAFIVPDLPFALCGRRFALGDNPRVSAQFSIPFTAALALKKGRLSPRDFLPENVLAAEKERGALIKNITVTAASPSIGAQATVPCRMVVKLKEGRIIERSTDTIRGSVGRPATQQEEWEKLKASALDIFDDHEVRQLKETARRLRKTGTAAIAELLGAARSRA